MNDDTNFPDDQDGELDERDLLRALDPDADAVPVELRLWAHKQVWVNGEPSTLTASPPVWYGDTRRARERRDEAGEGQ